MCVPSQQIHSKAYELTAGNVLIGRDDHSGFRVSFKDKLT